MTRHICPECGVVTSLDGGRCERHRKARNARRHDPFYSDPRWVGVSRRLLAAHVGRWGWVCPGEGDHAPHPSRDLTVDHILPRAEGGADFARSNLRILCRSWNSSLGARLINERRKSERVDRGRHGSPGTSRRLSVAVRSA